jgi:hypothetical protein
MLTERVFPDLATGVLLGVSGEKQKRMRRIFQRTFQWKRPGESEDAIRAVHGVPEQEYGREAASESLGRNQDDSCQINSDSLVDTTDVVQVPISGWRRSA